VTHGETSHHPVGLSRGSVTAHVRHAWLCSPCAGDSFLSKYARAYSPEEASVRKAIFATNLAAVEAHNALGLPWTKGVNKWADLTGDEWRSRVSGDQLRCAAPCARVPLARR